MLSVQTEPSKLDAKQHNTKSALPGLPRASRGRPKPSAAIAVPVLQMAPATQVAQHSASGPAAGLAGGPKARRPASRRGVPCAARRAPRSADGCHMEPRPKLESPLPLRVLQIAPSTQVPECSAIGPAAARGLAGRPLFRGLSMARRSFFSIGVVVVACSGVINSEETAGPLL